jgi:SulP family sulfate permease
VYVGRNVSIAHGALVHGPSFVGDDTFIGFKAVVHDATVGERCFIGIGAVVVGVEVPAGRFVPPGSIVDTPEKVQALPPVSEAQREFNEDVVEVNRGLASAYRESDGARALGSFPASSRASHERPGPGFAGPHDRF